MEYELLMHVTRKLIFSAGGLLCFLQAICNFHSDAAKHAPVQVTCGAYTQERRCQEADSCPGTLLTKHSAADARKHMQDGERSGGLPSCIAAARPSAPHSAAAPP